MSVSACPCVNKLLLSLFLFTVFVKDYTCTYMTRYVHGPQYPETFIFLLYVTYYLSFNALLM